MPKRKKEKDTNKTTFWKKLKNFFKGSRSTDFMESYHEYSDEYRQEKRKEKKNSFYKKNITMKKKLDSLFNPIATSVMTFTMGMKQKKADVANIEENHIICPKCKKLIEISSEMMDKRITCPNCKDKIYIPDLEKEEKEKRKKEEMEKTSLIVVNECIRRARKRENPKHGFEWMD
ncbi:MAG: hypothetical protein U9N32_08480 [Spirochaetota bacterium]|nr:hypothetical protein [Spirochaetota bacterium]